MPAGPPGSRWEKGKGVREGCEGEWSQCRHETLPGGEIVVVRLLLIRVTWGRAGEKWGSRARCEWEAC